MSDHTTIIIRAPNSADVDAFVAAMLASDALHHPWVKAPQTPQEYADYYQRSLLPNQKYYFVCNAQGVIVGVFNISEIVRGLFQSAYLGFYAVSGYEKHGYMSTGLKLVLNAIFNDLKLHRIEANIQPANLRSINLVKGNGFRYEGYSPNYLKINDEWRGHEHWAMTLEDYVEKTNLEAN